MLQTFNLFRTFDQLLLKLFQSFVLVKQLVTHDMQHFYLLSDGSVNGFEFVTLISFLFHPVSRHCMSVQTGALIPTHLQRLERRPSHCVGHALVSPCFPGEFALFHFHVSVAGLVHVILTLLPLLLLTLPEHLLYALHGRLGGKCLLPWRRRFIVILRLSLALQTESILGLGW